MNSIGQENFFNLIKEIGEYLKFSGKLLCNSQRGLDRPFAPVQVIRHLTDGVNHINIPILRHPAGFLGELCASQQQGIEQFGID